MVKIRRGNCEIPSAVRSREVTQGLSPKEQGKNPEETSEYWCHRGFHKAENRDFESPENSRKDLSR
jgi:hypothetical protein